MGNNYFTHNPDIDFDQENIEKPFKLKNRTIYVSNIYNGKSYKVRIEKGYEWNGANIPRFAWTLIGLSPTDPRVAEASMVHDKLCENKNLISSNGVEVSSKIFRDILLLQKDITPFKANLMMGFVRGYQMFMKGWAR